MSEGSSFGRVVDWAPPEPWDLRETLANVLFVLGQHDYRAARIDLGPAHCILDVYNTVESNPLSPNESDARDEERVARALGRRIG